MELRARMWPLINKYERLVRWKKLKKSVKDDFDYSFRESIKLVEGDRNKISREVVKRVASLPIYGEVYRKACEILGVKNSVELTILTLELPLHLTLHGLKGLLGLNPNRTKGRYNRGLRCHIAAFAANLYLKVKQYINVPAESIETINRLPKKAALCELQLMTLKALRIAYFTIVKPLSGESS